MSYRRNVQEKKANNSTEPMEPASVGHLVHRSRAYVSAGSAFRIQQCRHGGSGAGGGDRNPDGYLGKRQRLGALRAL